MSNPQRIISLVPSQTELLYDLGLTEQVVGVTKFCVHPKEWLQTKTIVGGTKQVHYDKIDALKPDLILTNKEENTKEMVTRLYAQYPLYMSDIQNLEDALMMIRYIGHLTDTSDRAASIVQDISTSFDELSISPLIPAAYVIWNDPIMVAASGTFIDDMMTRAGFSNIFSARTRYPVVELDDPIWEQAQYIFLSSEPYPFKEKHVQAMENKFPRQHTMLVNGELFSWYGSRLRYSAAYFKELKETLES